MAFAVEEHLRHQRKLRVIMHCMNVACDPQQGGSLTETNTKEEKEGELICKDGQICSNKLITEISERGTTQCVVVHTF